MTFYNNSATYDDTKIYPALIKADLGTSAIFTCLTSAYAIWSFSSDGMKKQANSMYMGTKLVIDVVELKHNGYYFCSGTDPDTKRQFVARAELKVYGETL